jgi:hypothetical protein
VDEAGARTLAAACQSLHLNGRRVEVRGLRREVSAALNRLGPVLADVPGPRRRPHADPASATA